MGNSQSSKGEKTGKSVIESKLAMAAKTGVLNISGQGIKLKSNVWNQLSEHCYDEKLKSLDISMNPLKVLPTVVVNLSKLKTLIISKCQLTSLPDMDGLISLASLNASHNDLRNDNVGQIPPSLSKLDLSFNAFVAFPVELVVTSNLTELNLSNNAIVMLDGIGQLASLVWLVLDNNEISYIPHEIGNLKRLKHISLKNNSIAKKIDGHQSISPELFTQTSTEEINLEGNRLSRDDVMEFVGVDEFIARRQLNKNKLLQGGGMLDLSVFGLE